MTRQEIEARLLDYVMGEVNASERAAIDVELEKDAGLRDQVHELRETVGLIAAAGDGAGERLSAERREAVLAGVVAPPAARRAFSGPIRWALPAGLAAAALLAVGMGAFRSATSSRDAGTKELARVPGTQPAALLENRTSRQQLIEKLEADNEAANIQNARLVTELSAQQLSSVTPRSGDSEADLRADSLRERMNELAQEKQAAGAPATLHGRTKDLAAAGRNGVRGNPAGPQWGGMPAEAYGDRGEGEFNTEEYAHLAENPFLRVAEQALSTFSIDVDTASYSNLRRFLSSNRLPPPDAVRIEEMINYFTYDYADPEGEHPFSVALESHAAPWAPKHRLVRIGLRGKAIAFEQRPVSNLVFLIDVSGSMNEADKLPLVQRSLRLLVDHLTENDRVAMVVYAGSSGLVLPSTTGDRKQDILGALDRLSAGGSTNGGAGIQLAYRTAEEHFVQGGVNRVILCTDGDFNVGATSEGDLVRLIEDKRKSGVFLSVLGFGGGNYADARMQQLADKGNGNAYYIDTLAEARKVLVEQASGTLVTIAKDVKIQVEFNPARVAAYRLIGYENRMLAAQDFNDDKKDAGEIGAGHQVTALYEIVPAGQEVPSAPVDPLKYQAPPAVPAGGAADEMLTVKLRYKLPEGDTSTKLEVPFRDAGIDGEEPSADYHFASSVAMFGMLLRHSEHKGQASFALAIELAQAGLADDRGGYRKELVELMKKAKQLANQD